MEKKAKKEEKRLRKLDKDKEKPAENFDGSEASGTPQP